MLYIQVGSGFTKPLDSYPREDANWFVSVTKNNECSYIDLHKMQTFFVQIQQFSNAAFTWISAAFPPEQLSTLANGTPELLSLFNVALW